MVKFQPSFSFWPRPKFLGDSRDGLATWIVDRDALRDNRHHDDDRETAIQRIIDNHHDQHGHAIVPSKPVNTDV